jgi:ADP-heptose:LPS heptosyltransferase
MKRYLRSLMLLLARLIGGPGAILAARKAHNRPGERMRILLVRPDHLGDLVMVTPVLNALKEQVPQAEISMLVGPWSREVVARHPALKNVETCIFPGFQRAAQNPLAPYVLLFQLAGKLRRERYDLAVNLRPDFWWGAALLYLAGIPRRVGYAIEPGKPFLTHMLPFVETEHASVSNLRLASTALQSVQRAPLAEPFRPEHYPLRFTPTEQEKEWVRTQLEAQGIGAEVPLVVIHPGTGGAVKLWRAEGWARCADWLVEEGCLLAAGTRIVLTGTPKERPLLEEIAGKMKRAVPVLMSEQSVGQLAALLARAELVLGVDNGPLHLAVAQETLTLGLFGPTDVRIFGPWGREERHAVILSGERCPGCPLIPCGRLDFTEDELADHLCVKRISEEQVEQAIARLTGGDEVAGGGRGSA